MERSSFREANSRSASQGISRLIGTRRVITVLKMASH